ncbi:MAG: MFS transporter [Candidatus Bathyarchaeia archaeon]|nr:MFS transporter [Candidatus Bathyarchaeota archaeon]
MGSRYRWLVFSIFFLFMLVHQADKLLIGPLTTPIMESFGIDEARMGAVSSFAIMVAAIFYPIWGYLYDRYARAKLIALASFIWGSTTWLNALAPNYTIFLLTRGSTGIDDSSYPGIHSLLSDYFEPSVRSRVWGILSASGPLGYVLGMVLAVALSGSIGWRGVFFVTGTMGILIAALILLGVREMPRGRAEPEFAGLEIIPTYHFDPKAVKGLLRNPSMRFLLIQGFFGVFPWNALTYWVFRYLETERGYTTAEAAIIMIVAIAALTVGGIIWGFLGDLLFKRTQRGRALLCTIVVFSGAISLLAALTVPIENRPLFLTLIALTAFIIPVGAANVTPIIQDIVEPEIRSTAQALQGFTENIGSGLAPFMVGLIAVQSSLGYAILSIGVSTWILCSLFFGLLTLRVPRDMERLRMLMRERARMGKTISEPSKP